MLLTILIILLVLAAVGGGWGHSRWGYAGWSPVGIVVLIIILFWLTGGFHAGHLRW